MPANAASYSLEDILPILVGVLGQGRMGDMANNAAGPQSTGTVGGPATGTPSAQQRLPIGGIDAVHSMKTRKGQLAAGIGSVIGNALIANKNMGDPLGLPWWLGGKTQEQRTADSLSAPKMMDTSRHSGGGSPTANMLADPQASAGGGGMGGGGGGLMSMLGGLMGGGGGAAGAGAAGAAGAGAGAAAGGAAAGGAAAGAGAAAGGGGSLLGLLGMLCWVAEELFGRDDMRTWLARLWCAEHRDHPFVRAYTRYGRAWAGWLRAHPWAKPIVAPVWKLMARRGAAIVDRGRRRVAA